MKASTNMYICKLSVLTKRKKKKGWQDNKLSLRRSFILPCKQADYKITEIAMEAAITFSSIKDKASITNPVSKKIWKETIAIITSSMTVPHSQTKEVKNHILTVIPIYLLKKLHASV
jgi:hypothetical protein